MKFLLLGNWEILDNNEIVIVGDVQEEFRKFLLNKLFFHKKKIKMKF